MDDLYTMFGLTPLQCDAARERQRDTAVTAGAGSGKTRTLVARYLALLSEGFEPRRVVAITFTDKAAREMRNRVRSALQRLVQQAGSPDDRRRWADLEAGMDSARIGTIHNLCAEILRSHPAEAGIDPQFSVVEENQAAVLQTRAVADALAWAAGQTEMGQLLAAYQIQGLQNLLQQLLTHRLDLNDRSFDPSAFDEILCRRMAAFLDGDEVRALLEELRQARAAGSLASLAGDKLADQVVLLLEQIDCARQAVKARNSLEAGRALFRARRELLSLRAGKTGTVKEAVRALQTCYDGQLTLWLGGKKSDDTQPNETIEALQAQVLPLLGQLYRRTEQQYLQFLEQRSSLDFDGLEAGALRLLQIPAVRARWQAEIQAVLVDEFQDTNARQRQLVLALCGEHPGRLFVVGDARQSIYRFRGADVTVFTGLLADVRARGGLSIDLDLTFRAHPGLLDAAGVLLRGIMGDQPQPGRPYAIPYAPLVSARNPLDGGTVRPPFIELILGMPGSAQDSRPAAARALARRLLELRQSGEIGDWGEVALLFRASTTFPVYEESLEAASIPYVTVAGSGFYDRPEVRDVINLLRALSNPWDDLALAGLLRSPVFGLSDVGLYRLRNSAPGHASSLFRTLRGNLSMLDDADRRQAVRAREVLAEFLPLVGRLPVADLLRRLAERCGLRAVLAAGSGRLWRNVDKLISDAAASGLVQVRAFLEYLDTLRDTGARESEAAPEADGAVRLMTIHKSKGLEFPCVVLADAARENVSRQNGAYRLGECWSARLAGEDSLPLAYRLAAYLEKDQDDAEAMRLLYVALTRAKEKLLISGHVGLDKGGNPQARGWLNELLAAGGADLNQILDMPGQWRQFDLPGRCGWSACAYPEADLPQETPRAVVTWPESSESSLALDLTVEPAGEQQVIRPGGIRALPLVTKPPAKVVSDLARQALLRWQFPGDAGLETLLLARVREEGLQEDSLANEAVQSAERLLLRFQQHPLFREIVASEQCFRDLPYHTRIDSCEVNGVVDCLYRSPAGWVIVHYCCVALHSYEEMNAIVQQNQRQLVQQCEVVQSVLNEKVQVQLVFLNIKDQVKVISLPDPVELV